MKIKIIPFLIFYISVLALFSCTKTRETTNDVVLSTEEYFRYTVNGTNYDFTMPVDSVSSDTLYETIQFSKIKSVRATRIPSLPNNIAGANFYDVNTTVGSIQEISIFFTPETGVYFRNGGNLPGFRTCTSPVNLAVTITEYGLVNQYIAGYFSGLLIGPAPANTNYIFSCKFRVRRRI